MATVTVPQESGDIEIRDGRGTVHTYTATDHAVEVEDDLVALVITAVPGSSRVEPTPVAADTSSTPSRSRSSSTAASPSGDQPAA